MFQGLACQTHAEANFFLSVKENMFISQKRHLILRNPFQTRASKQAGRQAGEQARKQASKQASMQLLVEGDHANSQEDMFFFLKTAPSSHKAQRRCEPAGWPHATTCDYLQSYPIFPDPIPPYSQ